MNSKTKGRRVRNARKSNSPKGARSGPKDSRYDDEGFEKTSKSSNSPTWYGNPPELLRDGFSYPSHYIPGTVHDLGLQPFGGLNIQFSSSGINPANFVAPGLLVEWLRPQYDTSSATNALNNASLMQYIYVNSMNSRNYSYDPNDLMLYTLAMTEVYSMLFACQRLYALAYMYAAQSNYMPAAHLRAYNVDVTTLSTELVSFREGLNWIINQVNSLPVPAGMALYQRKVFLYSNVYSEGNSVKDQQYMYMPQTTLRFKLNKDVDVSGMLEEVRTPFGGVASQPHTLKSILDFVQDMYTRVWNMQDHQTMAADILKAYNGNIIKIAPLDIAPVFAPVVGDYAVLEQMQNASIMDQEGVSPRMGNLIQDMATNTLVWDQEVTQPSTELSKLMATVQSGSQIVTTTTPSASPELLAEITRLTANISKNADDKPVLVAGTEYVDHVQIITRAKNTATANLPSLVEAKIDGVYVSNIDDFNPPQITSLAWYTELLGSFKYAPYIEVLFYYKSGETYIVSQMMRTVKVDNYYIFDSTDLDNMHSIALSSLLAVPKP